MDTYAAVCASGTLRPADKRGSTHFDHRWTDGGVDVVTDFTGAHLLHTAVAACVLNDLYREAQALGVQLDGVRVQAEGGFNPDWSSGGIEYRVEVDSPSDQGSVDRLLAVVDEVAEIPKALRAGTSVVRLR